MASQRTVKVPILMYHYISVPPADADVYRVDLSVPPDLFAAHLDRLQAEGYTTISLYQLLAHLTQGAPLPEKPVVITFDDGYRDVSPERVPAAARPWNDGNLFCHHRFYGRAAPAVPIVGDGAARCSRRGCRSSRTAATISR